MANLAEDPRCLVHARHPVSPWRTRGPARFPVTNMMDDGSRVETPGVWAQRQALPAGCAHAPAESLSGYLFPQFSTPAGRARLPPSRDVTVRPQLCRLVLLRGPIPAIPFNKPAPPAPRAAQRELRPPIRCGHSPHSMRPFRGRVSGSPLTSNNGETRNWPPSSH